MSGKIYDGSGVVDLPFTWLDKHPNGLADGLRWEFHPDSRLFKIDGCINEKDCGYYDYIMEEGKGLKLIRKQLLPPEFQP